MVYTLRFFPIQNAVCFIILTCLVPVLFTFYIQDLYMCSSTCICVQVLVYVLKYLYMCSSTCICVQVLVYVFKYLYMCLKPLPPGESPIAVK